MLNTFIKYRRTLDFVIIDTYSTYSFYYAWLIARLSFFFKIPYIPILHGGNLPQKLSSSPTLTQQVFHHAYCNVAPSGYLQTALAKYGYKTAVIPNFILIQQYLFRKREQVRPRLLWVRSFEKTYNPTMAVKVLASLKEKYPDATLCMVGPDKDGSLAQCQQLAADLKLADRITFTGKRSKADWHHLAQDYDIFINTTNADNTPVSVIEAMALGLPVVSTNVGGIPYLLKDMATALLIPPSDTSAMVNAITQLVENNTLAKRLSETARHEVEAFDAAIVLAKWGELLGNERV